MLRIAVNRVEGLQADGRPQVIVIDGRRVVEVRSLNEEEPFTIWRGGTAVISGEGRQRQATIDGRVLDEDALLAYR